MLARFSLLAVSFLSALVSAQAPVRAPTSVDRAGVYMRIAPLNDNSLLAAYAATNAGTREIRISRSTDNGVTWNSVSVVASGPAADFDIDNAYPIQLPSGIIAVAFRNHDRADTENGFSYYRITLCYSRDNGATWEFRSQIDERAATNRNGLWEPLLRIARDGSLQAYYSLENNPGDQDNVMKVSRDDGLTWGATIAVSGTAISNSRDGMIGIDEMADGTLICVFENNEGGTPMHLNYVLSRDDGLTWNTRTPLYTSPNGRHAGAPSIVNVGGTLVAGFMTNEDGGEEGGVDGGQFKVITSTNNGQSWSAPVTIRGTGSHWPGLFTVSPTNFLGLYSFQGEGLLAHEHRL